MFLVLPEISAAIRATVSIPAGTRQGANMAVIAMDFVAQAVAHVDSAKVADMHPMETTYMGSTTRMIASTRLRNRPKQAGG
jgi:hypothetical protein